MKRFGLSGEERIKSKKDFEKIFSCGTAIFSSDLKIKANYIIEPKGCGVKFAAAISKKSGSAFWRNRVKRLLREAYRLNKNTLIDFSFRKKILLKIVFSPHRLNQNSSRKILLKEIEPAVIEIMNKAAAAK